MDARTYRPEAAVAQDGAQARYPLHDGTHSVTREHSVGGVFGSGVTEVNEGVES